MLSSGPTVTYVQVPPVINDQFTQATQVHSSAGLNYKTRYITSNKPQGTVLTQVPAGGTRVKSTTTVQLTVSGTADRDAGAEHVLGNSPAAAGSLLKGSEP